MQGQMYRWAVALNRSREISFQNLNRIITAARIVSIKRRSVHVSNVIVKATFCPASQNAKFNLGKIGLCIAKNQNQVSDEKSACVKLYVFGVTVRLPGVLGTEHTGKKASGIEAVYGKTYQDRD